MSEDKKYEIVGKVEIGTDEYRDLVESCTKYQMELNDVRRDNWKKDDEIKELKKKVEAQEKAIKSYRNFVNMSEERQSSYQVYLVQIKEDSAE